MKYDLSNQLDLNKFITKAEKLIEKGAKVELKENKPIRSLSHNAYLHVCITLFAIEFGYHLEDAKYTLKKSCSFMHRYEGDKLVTFKTSKLTDSELSRFVDWIRNYSSMQGCYIPTPEEYITNRFDIDREISKNSEFL